LAELQLCQTSSGVAAPPQSSSTAELGSYSGAAEMCLAKVTTPAPETEVLIGFPFFALVFLFAVLFSLAAPKTEMCMAQGGIFFSNNKLTCHTFDYVTTLIITLF